MKRKNMTRNALVTSILALLVCVSMLVGTTFAWFTDSVVSGVNTIAAGNLDVELYHGKTKTPEDKVDSSTVLFTDFEGKLIEHWEPGVVAFTNLKVANEGSLALKYQMALNFTNANYVEYEGQQYTLADVLKVAVVEDGFASQDRAAAHELFNDPAVKVYDLASFGLDGQLETKEESEIYGIVVYWEPNSNDVDNIYNMNNGKTTSDGKPLTITLGVNLFATQVEYEEDSFGNDYDKNVLATVNSVDALRAAINNANGAGTIYLEPGIYNINSQITIPGKSLNIVGLGDNVVIHMTDRRANYNKIFYIYGSAEGEDVTVDISNVTLTADIPTKSDVWIRTDTKDGAKVNGDVTVNLNNVTCASVICDNNYVDGDTVNLNINNSRVGKAALDASPFNGNGLNTYTNLTYKNSRIDSITINPNVEDLTHITINGVKPTAHGEQQPLKYIDTAEELQAAINAAEDGDIIVLGADITGDVIVPQKEGINITIDGAGNKYDGTIKVDGNGRSAGAETLTIKNINFVTQVARDFISANESWIPDNGTNYNYAHNVTIVDCTFTNKGTGTVVPARFRQAYNITMENCTVEGTFSPLWTTGVQGLTIKKVTANCTNEGMTIGASNNVLIESCVITVPGETSFGIRTDAYAGYKLTVNNCILNTAKDIVIRNPVDTYTVIVDNVPCVATASQLNDIIASANESTTIRLVAGTYEGVELTGTTAKNLTIVGTEGAVVKGIHGVEGTSQLKVIGLTLKNINFQDKGLYFDNKDTPWNYVENLTMTDCTFVGTGTADDSVGNRLFDVGGDSPGSNQYFNVVIEGCTVSNAIQGIRLGGVAGTGNKVVGNTISNVGHNAITVRSTASGSKLLVEGNTISNGADRAFRIGSNLGTISYENNVITNCGDPEDGSNFKATTLGTVTFEGNTLNGVAWNPLD